MSPEIFLLTYLFRTRSNAHGDRHATCSVRNELRSWIQGRSFVRFATHNANPQVLRPE